MQKKAEKKNVRNQERMHDNKNNRGFSTDQRISIESMNINKKRLVHQQNETRLYGLSIQASAIQSQIESAETRANQRCLKYHKSNVYWKRVDALLEEQNEVIETIKEHSRALITNDVTESFKTEVSEFLNQESPSKKHSYSNLLGESNVIAFNISDEDNGLQVKKEMVDEVTKSCGVSRSKRNK